MSYQNFFLKLLTCISYNLASKKCADIYYSNISYLVEKLRCPAEIAHLFLKEFPEFKEACAESLQQNVIQQ